MGACGSVRNYSIPEICIVRGNLVCVQSIWTVRKFSICHNYIAGNHLCGCGYVATARRNGNQRTVIFKNIFTIFGSKLLLPGMLLSRGLGYYTELILSALLTIVANLQ